ncbi:hypothetical protein BDP27DRAFT_1364192 [Rhodocollybia butyracea]|uniref:Uncharacterized protein n=1 Tax=Rhodocollybia butyracea TaxID=206335 RepID=A0A9P5PUM8_9AGAR|nr:hypothetical protein BDP27DRAFT_1364192 [Rhodocollybia butyracea]
MAPSRNSKVYRRSTRVVSQGPLPPLTSSENSDGDDGKVQKRKNTRKGKGTKAKHNSDTTKRTPWFTKKVDKLEAEKTELQQKNNELKAIVEVMRIGMCRAKLQLDAHNEEHQAHRVVTQITDTSSQADITAATIVEHCHFVRKAAEKVESCGRTTEVPSVTLPPEVKRSHSSDDYTLQVQLLLQSVLVKWCTSTIQSWTAGRMHDTDTFLGHVYQYMKAEASSFYQELVPALADVLWSRGGIRSLRDGGDLLMEERFTNSFQQIVQCCLNLEQDILGRKSVEVHLIVPQHDEVFVSDVMNLALEEEGTKDVVAFTCELGLLEESSSGAQTLLLKPGVILCNDD